MPRNQFQRMVFAFLTVVVTVHAYVFYSLYVVNGTTLMAVTQADSVLHAISAQGGVYLVGRFLPIWAVVLVEFCFAYGLEVLVGSPCSFKLASRVFDPRRNHPMLFETAIICTTVGIMCPAMSLIAAWLYYGLQPAYPAGQLAEAGLRELPLRLFLPVVLYPAPDPHPVQAPLPQRH